MVEQFIPETIYDLSNEEYHRGQYFKSYVSSTQLKDYIVSPKYANYKRENPELFEISKEAESIGSLYHNCMDSIVRTGSIDAFTESVIIFSPPINSRTGKPYSRTSDAFLFALESHKKRFPDKELISQSDLDLVLNMVKELINGCGQTSKDIRQLIKWGKSEVSHFVNYKDCKFKYRPDLETKKKIVDWKTVAVDDLHHDTIVKIILKFKYDISAAFYQFFEHERTGKWKEFYWVFQQKSPPYDAILVSAQHFAYSFNEEDDIVKMGSGALKFKSLLDQHIYCTKNNLYDGAQVFIQPEFMGRRILSPEPPSYEKMKLLTYYNE